MSVRRTLWIAALASAGAAAVVGVAAANRAASATDVTTDVRYAAVPQQARAAPRREPGCERCHGELELLRQQAGTLTRARELLVPDSILAASAHAQESCASCHTGFARFPHVAAATSTASCASCHEAADTLWSHGAHARSDQPVQCADCHTIHAVASIDTARAGAGAAALNAPCISCHEVDALAAHDPHAADVSCAGCHAPHDTRAVDDSASWLAPAQQARTCAACHDSTAAVWQQDIHGDSALQRLHGARDVDGPVLCTSCHAGHTMRAVEDTAFAAESVMRCALCHEQAARTFFGSYHGKATALGSVVAASCYDCHGAHEILPDTFAASHVAKANLVATCRGCHEHARPRFVLYDSHPDPFDRGRNPWIFYSFWLMNGLLIFVVVVFGGHTVLWWIRLWLDRRRGVQHGHGGAS